MGFSRGSHSSLTVHHVYSVPDAAVFQIRALACASLEFGCGSKAQPETQVLSALYASEKHRMVVLHHRYDSLYGWKCWIATEHLQQLLGILQVFHLHSRVQLEETVSAS
ncbi:hypothetical protein [Deinococcus roseus]|uniref:Uncharacterized protein n=1 Tax=Deinococcus roseus TaxID=392414 RepID=A0ABQ2CUN9_9DEIO|nr:hypothetical protein [Deinococcus roseus]GGJ22033.1 hypothetical protein GCM10008938_05400 [Deinococcus roseus]